MDRFRICFGVFFIVLLLQSVAFATDRHVGSGQTYSTISSAISAAASGDVVYIHAGTYNEGLNLSGKTNVTVTRYNNDNVVIRGSISTSGGSASVFPGNNCTVSYLTFQPSSGVANVLFVYDRSNWTFSHNAVISPNGTGNWIHIDKGSGFAITNNNWSGYTDYIAKRIMNTGGNWVYRWNSHDCSSLSTSVEILLITDYVNQSGQNSTPCYMEFNRWYNIGAIGGPNTPLMFRQTDGFYFRNNVIELTSANNSKSYTSIRGSTDRGRGCQYFYMTHNTWKNAASDKVFVDIADTNMQVKITNNIIYGNVGNFVHDLTPSSVGSGNIVEHNHVSDSSITAWLGTNVAGYGWTQTNNVSGQAVVWNTSFPFTLTQSLDGGSYTWNPTDDYVGTRRTAPQDVGAFEFGSSGPVVGPQPPIGLRVLQ